MVRISNVGNVFLGKSAAVWKILTCRIFRMRFRLRSIMNYSTFLQRSTRNQSSSGGSFTFLSGLPPISIILRHDMQDVTSLKSQTRFFAWNIRIKIGIIDEMRSNANFAFSLTHFTVRGDQLESDCSLGVLLFGKIRK